MTRGQQILAQLLTADIKAGKVQVKGAELFLAGQKVEPMLTYETVGPAASSGVRLSPAAAPVPVVKDEPMTTTFAALPREVLVARAQREELLQDRARAAARSSAWQGNFAPLPAGEPLMARGDQDEELRVNQTKPSVWGTSTMPLPRDPLTEGES